MTMVLSTAPLQAREIRTSRSTAFQSGSSSPRSRPAVDEKTPGHSIQKPRPIAQPWFARRRRTIVHPLTPPGAREAAVADRDKICNRRARTKRLALIESLGDGLGRGAGGSACTRSSAAAAAA